MGRPLRIEYPDGMCHVTARRNARPAPVADGPERAKWLAVLAKTAEWHGWRVFVLAPMDNAFHSRPLADPRLAAAVKATTDRLAANPLRR